MSLLTPVASRSAAAVKPRRWPLWLLVAVATLSKVFWEPIREGRPDPRQWPRGLRPVMLVCAGAYLLAIMLVLASGWIRSHDTLVYFNGDSFPAWALTVLLWLLVLTFALALCAALHTHPGLSLLTYSLCLLSILTPTILLPGVATMMAWLALLGLVLFALMRARRHYAWFEFPIILALVSAAVYVPLAVTPVGVGADLRPAVLTAMLGAINSVAAPALIMAGYAPAEIAVSLGEWLQNRIRRETLRRPRRRVVLGVALAIGGVVCLYDVGRGLIGEDWEFRSNAWQGSAVILGVTVLGCWLMLRRRPGRLPDRPTAQSWKRDAYLLVILGMAPVIWASLMVPLGSTLSTVAGVDGVTELAGWAMNAWFHAFWLVLLTLLSLVWAFRARRCDERARVVLLVCYAVVSSTAALWVFSDGRYSVSWSVPTLAALAVLLCLMLVPVALLRRRGVEERLWIVLLALFISAMVGRRELLADPGALMAGISGLAVLFLGLVWRGLTEASITRRGSRWFPVPTRVLFYAANALLAALAIACVALVRPLRPTINLASWALTGEISVGTPLILGAILLGALSTIGGRRSRGMLGS